MEKITVSALVAATGGCLRSGSPEQTVHGVTTDSRQVAAGKHLLFVPIAGERVDAHRFLQDVRSQGAAAAFASSSFLSSPAGAELLKASGIAADAPATNGAGSAAGSLADSAGCRAEAQQFCLIEVADTLAALQAAAAWYRSLFSIPVIGITGSVGKTTTKEMVAAALGSVLAVHKTAGNQNSQVGLPLTLFGLERKHQAAVIEMGMSEFGEMARIAAIARPDHAVFTNIGVAHIGNLGSQQNIRSEKLHITDFFHEGSVLILNGDDPLLLECARPEGLMEGMPGDKGGACILYHAGESFIIPETEGFCQAALAPAPLQEATGLKTGLPPVLSAENIEVCGEGTQFNLRIPENCLPAKTPTAGHCLPVQLKTLGMHNVRNALAAIAAALALGIAPEDAVRGLAQYQPPEMRGRLISAGSIRLLDDSYNASPDSMKGAVEVLSSLSDASRRIVVFADVLELGERSAALHREVGSFLAAHNQTTPNPLHLVAAIGPESVHILEGFREGCKETAGNVEGCPAELHHFGSNAEAITFLKEYLSDGDVVLVKGSRGMHTEEIVTALREYFTIAAANSLS